jgi:hypothetical protein
MGILLKNRRIADSSSADRLGEDKASSFVTKLTAHAFCATRDSMSNEFGVSLKKSMITQLSRIRFYASRHIFHSSRIFLW